MLKNVLEANGYEMVHYMTGKVNRGIEYMTIGIDGITQQIGDKIYPMEWDKERHYEERAKQYVRENGFKLEWFDDKKIRGTAKEIYTRTQDYLWEELLEYVLIFHTVGINKRKNLRLIAWLYSEDIKIVEE